MKRSVYTIGSLIILLIAAFVFVLVPIFAGGTKQKTLPPFGKFENIQIKYEQNSDFSKFVANYADNFKNNGADINPQTQYYIYNYAFNATVYQLTAKKAVKETGYIVPDTLVNRAMIPYFTDEKGNYSSKMYRLADPQQVAEMRESFEKDFYTRRYSDDNFGSQTDSIGEKALYGLKISENELKFVQDMNNNQRSFNMVSFDMNKYPDTEKAAYGKANSEKFVTYNLSVITVADKSKAESVAKKIASEEITFEDAVKEYSQKSYSSDSGVMTSKYNYQLVKIIEDESAMNEVASLKKDQVSSPVKTSIGYSIFKANGDAETPDFTKEATLKTVYNYLTSYEFSHIEDYYTETAKAFASVAAKKGFNAACNQYNVKKLSVPAFPLNYGSVSIADKLDTSLEGLSGANTNENFLKTAFSLKEGEISEPITINKNLVVLQLDKSNVKPKETVPAEAIADELLNINQNTAQTAILTSPKVENNVADVFYNHIMANN